MQMRAERRTNFSARWVRRIIVQEMTAKREGTVINPEKTVLKIIRAPGVLSIDQKKMPMGIRGAALGPGIMNIERQSREKVIRSR